MGTAVRGVEGIPASCWGRDVCGARAGRAQSGPPRTSPDSTFPGRFIQGSATRSPYVFYHWQYIDIFVYFSHHVVTIPPVGWTNAAHRNGVSVLGEGLGPVAREGAEEARPARS